MMMQHQYWVTKKSVLRKLGGKEDECIVSSDAELDAKLELFKSINDSCIQLQKAVDLYQERLCYLVQEENALGRYLKECRKDEKNASANQLTSIAGKALAYMGHQRLTLRPSLVRLHHEVETFRGRAVSDTKGTVMEMEKSRTEYRAALSWMKSASTQLDPDIGQGMDRFRKAQTYVKSTKMKFDHFTLTCLQKVDLLAAARCNMFSHALVPYQTTLLAFATKAAETLTMAARKLENIEPSDFLSTTCSEEYTSNDKDENTFFNAEYTDDNGKQKKIAEEITESANTEESDESLNISNLLGEDFSLSGRPQSIKEAYLVPTEESNKTPTELLDWFPINADFLSGEFMPSKLLQESFFQLYGSERQQNQHDDSKKKSMDLDTLGRTGSPQANNKNTNQQQKNDSQVSWLSLFAELDPLASTGLEDNTSGDRA